MRLCAPKNILNLTSCQIWFLNFFFSKAGGYLGLGHCSGEEPSPSAPSVMSSVEGEDSALLRPGSEIHYLSF